MQVIVFFLVVFLAALDLDSVNNAVGLHFRFSQFVIAIIATTLTFIEGQAKNIAPLAQYSVYVALFLLYYHAREFADTLVNKISYLFLKFDS